MAEDTAPKIEYPDFITLPDKTHPGRDLRLDKRVDANGVVYYSTKLDWRDPDA